jgi:MerR family transcriptional regulator, copper efflux regulator
MMANKDSVFSIGEAARASGVTAKAIRYCESAGLLPRAPRTSGNYRAYDQRAVETLRFLHRARDLGFQLEDIQKLLNLWNDRSRRSADVKALAHAHLAQLDAKIASLKSMRNTIATLAQSCHGDQRPDCPILDDLSRRDRQ